MIPSDEFDILIIGAGLAGASLACALRGSRFRVGVLEAAQTPCLAEGWDARIYAISPANVAFLTRTGVWPRLEDSACRQSRAWMCGVIAVGACSWPTMPVSMHWHISSK